MVEKAAEKVEKKDETVPVISEDSLMKAIAKLDDIAKSIESKPATEKAAEFKETVAAASDEVKKGLEVSEFLGDMVNEVATAIDNFGTVMTKASQDNDILVKSVIDAMKEIGGHVKTLTEKVEALEKSPVSGRKSIIKGVEVVERFDKSVEMTKSQISDALVKLFHKGEATVMDVARFDTTGKLSKNLEALIVKKEVE